MMQAGRLMVRNESHNKALYIIKKNLYIYASKTVNAVAPYLDTHILPNKYNRQEIRRRSLHIAASKCTPPTEPQYCCMTRQTNRLNGYTTQNHVKFIRDTHTHTHTQITPKYMSSKRKSRCRTSSNDSKSVKQLPTSMMLLPKDLTTMFHEPF